MKKKAKRANVPIQWTFAQRPDKPTMQKLKNGEEIRENVQHRFSSEVSGERRIKVWCEGCQEYFSSWPLALWRHGLTRIKPKEGAKRGL